MKNVINRALAAKKRFIALLLAIAASVGAMFAESGTCGDHLTWDLTDGVLTISGTGAMTDFEYQGAPWYSYESLITEVTIGNSVTSIGNYAFCWCTGLTSITIPNGVTSIGESAFQDCTGLTSITIGNSVTSIGDYAFGWCKGVKSVIWNAKNCVNNGSFGSQVESFTFGNEVESIPAYCCNGMNKLTSITIPNSVTSIGQSAFDYCTGLTSITCEAVTPPTCSGTVFYNVPKTIPLYVPVGRGDKYNAADQWKDFTNILQDLPCLIASGTCGEHLTWELSCDSVLTISGTGAMTDWISSSKVPWYNYRSSIKEVSIPNGVTSIGEHAFGDCTGLKSVTIPNSVTSIGWSAFEGCSGLTSITIPNSVTSIGWSAFGYCSGLTSITIPNSVTYIGIYAFYNCSGLTSITCEAVTPPTCDISVFDNVPKTIPLYVPAGSVDKYKAAYDWKEFGDNIKPIQAEQIEVVEPKAEPTTNSVVLSWPKKDDAVSYTIVIKKGTETICTLTFNADGQLTSIQFAPSRNGEPQQAPMATLTATGWQYTVSGLEANTDYSYTVIAKRSDDSVVLNETILFKTKNIPTGIDQVPSDQGPRTNKIMVDGQIFLRRGDKIYTITGAEIQ